MRVFILSSILALIALISARALPTEDLTPDIPLNGALTVDVQISDSDGFVPIKKRATGASGTLYYRWISSRTFAASYHIKDLACDGHPVYIDTSYLQQPTTVS